MLILALIFWGFGCTTDPNESNNKSEVSGILLPNPDDEADVELTGTTALGIAVKGASISVKNRFGEDLNMNATTNVQGEFQLSGKTVSGFPLEITATLLDGRILMTLVPTAEHSIRNLNPITTLARTKALQAHGSLDQIDEARFDAAGNAFLHPLLGEGFDFDWFDNHSFKARLSTISIGENVSVADVFLDMIQNEASQEGKNLDQFIESQVHKVETQEAVPFLSDNHFLIKASTELSEVESAESYNTVVSGKSSTAVPILVEQFKTLIIRGNSQNADPVASRAAIAAIAAGIETGLTSAETSSSVTEENLGHLSKNVTLLMGKAVKSVVSQEQSQSFSEQDLTTALSSTVNNAVGSFDATSLALATIPSDTLEEGGSLNSLLTSTEGLFNQFQETMIATANDPNNTTSLSNTVATDPDVQAALDSQTQAVTDKADTLKEVVETENSLTLKGFRIQSNTLKLIPNGTLSGFQSTPLTINENGEVAETPNLPMTVFTTPQGLPSLEVAFENFNEAPSGTLQVGLEFYRIGSESRTVKAIVDSVRYEVEGIEVDASIPTNQTMVLRAELENGKTVQLTKTLTPRNSKSTNQVITFNLNGLRAEIEEALGGQGNNFLESIHPGNFAYKIYVLPSASDIDLGVGQGEIFTPFKSKTTTTFTVGPRSIGAGAFVIQGKFEITP